MLFFGDIMPFLTENEDVCAALRLKLLDLLSNPQRSACLWIELAATIDWGEPFVKACYYLEGDGPLAVDCYEQDSDWIAYRVHPQCQGHCAVVWKTPQ